MDEGEGGGMTIHDVAAYLARFDAPPRIVQKWEDEAPDASADAASPLEKDEAAPAVDMLALRAEIEAQYAAAREHDHAAFEERLSRAREDWTTETAETLCRRLIDSLENAARDMRADVAKILRPFVAQKIADRATDELILSVRQAIKSDDARALTISGPADLLDKIGFALAKEDVAMKRIVSDAVDVRVEFQTTVVETCLDSWMHNLFDKEQD
jgi:hypothetical protein